MRFTVYTCVTALVPFEPIFDYGTVQQNLYGVMQQPDGTLVYMMPSWPSGYARVDGTGQLLFENFIPYCGCGC